VRETLFVIPHEVLGIPMFGLLGWIVIVWLVIGTGWMIWYHKQKKQADENDSQALQSPLMFIVIVALLFGVVVPLVEPRHPVSNEPVGMAIRGYGLFVLMGLVCGISLSAHLAKRLGLKVEPVFSLAVWLVISGMIGARAVYVIQYWHRFTANDPALGELLGRIVNLTQGGLVVYGSLIGGSIGSWIFLRRNKLPVLDYFDIMMPAMMVGLAFGRLGCLCFGCCFGGACSIDDWHLQFPPGSPPYRAQIFRGEFPLLPEIVKHHTGAEARVIPMGPDGSEALLEVTDAGDSDFAKGDQLLFTLARTENGFIPADQWPMMFHFGLEDSVVAELKLRDGSRTIPLKLSDLPAASLPVKPAQLLSAISATAICILLLIYLPRRRRPGQLLALMLTVYPIVRFLLENVRNDEKGQFGTDYTISQWISFLMIGLGVACWIWLQRKEVDQASA